MPTTDQIRWLERPRPCGCKHSSPWACRELQLTDDPAPTRTAVAEQCPCACHRLHGERERE